MLNVERVCYHLICISDLFIDIYLFYFDFLLIFSIYRISFYRIRYKTNNILRIQYWLFRCTVFSSPCWTHSLYLSNSWSYLLLSFVDHCSNMLILLHIVYYICTSNSSVRTITICYWHHVSDSRFIRVDNLQDIDIIIRKHLK